jgi:hypothetical protein
VKRLWLISLLVPLLGASLDGPQLLGAEPPELGARLREGGLVVLEDAGAADRDGFVVAYVLFARPRPRAIALVTDAARQVEWRPDLQQIETVERLPDGRIDRVRMRILFRDVTYHVRYRRDAVTGRIDWRLDPHSQNDLLRFEGFWEFYEMPEARTLARFGTLVDAGALVPAFVQRDLTRRSVRRTLENCRRWVDSDGAWRP